MHVQLAGATTHCLLETPLPEIPTPELSNVPALAKPNILTKKFVIVHVEFGYRGSGGDDYGNESKIASSNGDVQ
ncbi:hypothetical protein RND71_041522 [Anisodus tanguticus]|uniref:Uncharacterized protein n=1 Tax=Anisodus tanguticus TaxID=243964 RepID=A0AAE1UWT9_9SOLA|nr:hypothetical protein RND71_041522 [Anisodus tanguticus]